MRRESNYTKNKTKSSNGRIEQQKKIQKHRRLTTQFLSLITLYTIKSRDWENGF